MGGRKLTEVLLRGAARRRIGVVAALFALAVLVQAAVVFAGGSSHTTGPSAVSGSAPVAMAGSSGRVYVGHSYKNDVSPALSQIPALPLKPLPEREAAPNPRIGRHRNASDPVVQRALAPASMPAPTLSFDGIPFPGVGCNCAPPDTNGEVGATQYVQIVNEGFQVFDKATGNSVLGPNSISYAVFCLKKKNKNGGSDEPVSLYYKLADR